MSRRLLIVGTVLLLASAMQAQNPMVVEYFLDTDPGYGQARSATISTGINQLEFDVSDASPGYHLLSVRSQGSQGRWSATMSRPLFIDRPQDIVYVEYYIDDDPGVGEGTPLTLPAQGYKFHLDLGLQINTEGMALGEHELFVRACDALGQWTDVESRQFTIVEASGEEPAIKGDLARMEYFFDTDPGYGNAFPLKQASTGENTYQMSFESLTAGYHLLGIRAQDEDGRWSTVMSRPIYVTNPLKVTALEYFIDDDPGEGKALAVPLPDDLSEPFAFQVPATQLEVGEHRLCVRAKGLDGLWTLVTTKTFSVSAEGDLNGDGKVNVADIVILIKTQGDQPADEAEIQKLLDKIMQKK